MEAVNPPAIDRGEQISLMEPMVLPADSRHRGALMDLVVDLTSRSAGFRRSLPEGTEGPLAALVRSMNCYYSNLIEGHDTHPIDIERALRADFSDDATKRDLQLEARAHIEVQAWIDRGGLQDGTASRAAIVEVHRRFCEAMPPELLLVKGLGSEEPEALHPGALRARDVRVGNHVPVSPGAIPRFLATYEAVYERLGTSEALLAMAGAHHRLLWIHPFLDGNGRVARLLSHASLNKLLATGSVWSAARGLARRAAEYKAQLAACDAGRRNDLDGRSNLSEESLAAFTRFFLEVCIDQVEFMEQLVEPRRLRARIAMWAEEEIRSGGLPPRVVQLLEVLLYRGTLQRGEVAEVIGGSDRTARRVTAALIEAGALCSESPRAPLRLAFPAHLAGRWFPGLFPDRQP